MIRFSSSDVTNTQTLDWLAGAVDCRLLEVCLPLLHEARSALVSSWRADDANRTPLRIRPVPGLRMGVWCMYGVWCMVYVC